MLNLRQLGSTIAFGALIACGGDAPTSSAPGAHPAAPTGIKADKGVDVATKLINIGALNDESGPAAVIGKPYAAGKRLLAAQINAGGSGLLPDGWTVNLIERDHGYNPQKSTQAFKEIADEVLFIGTSFGTPNTLPLRPMLEAANVVAFPASLSSEMAKNKHTPPIGPSYILEAKRAMDWVVEGAADKGAIKAGIVYQQDDYGKDEDTSSEEKQEQSILRAIKQDLEDNPEMNTGMIDETTAALQSEEVDEFQQNMNVDDPRSMPMEEQAQPIMQENTEPAADEAMASMRDSSMASDVLNETREDPKSMGLMSREVV